MKQGAHFDVSQLPNVIEKIGFKPGKLKATLTGVLAEISTPEGQIKRKAIKIGDQDRQTYTLLENASLQTWLANTQIGQSVTLTGQIAVYQKKSHLWLSPKDQKPKKGTTLKGRFLVKRGVQLVFKSGNDEYIVLENALREVVENAVADFQEEQSVKGQVSEYQGNKYILIKERLLKS